MLKELVRSNPETFVHCYNTANNLEDYAIIEFLKEGKKISAIKRRRELTNEGLRDAKQYIDKLQETLRFQGVIS